jgi:lauroyl/myristoyl acyltransferase
MKISSCLIDPSPSPPKAVLVALVYIAILRKVKGLPLSAIICVELALTLHRPPHFREKNHKILSNNLEVLFPELPATSYGVCLPAVNNLLPTDL